MSLSEAKEFAVAAHVRGSGTSSNNSTRRRRDHCDDVFVAVGVDAERVVQFVCKHQK
jgi:hypothetical protein